MTPDESRDRAGVSAEAARPAMPADPELDSAAEEAPEPTISEMVAQQLGGVRGVVEASIPVTVFIIVNIVWPHMNSVVGAPGVSALKAAIWGSVGVAVLMTIFRLARRDSVRHALNGLFGVGLAAFFAARTGKAEGFYLPGIVFSYAEGAVFVLSVLIRRPLVGYAWSMITAGHFDWREHPRLVRTFAICTLAFTAAFWTNSSIQLALYFAEMPTALGVARLAGRSLYVAAVVFTVWYGRRTIRALEGTN